MHTMGLLEAHGTGTKLGDPIEVDGLRGAMAGSPAGLPPVALGTAKAHLGHAEGAAGVVGVIKAVLSLETGLAPAMPGFTRENPYLGLDSAFLAIPAATKEWRPRAGSVRRAGVSSFGFGGAGAHIVLEEAPRPVRPERADDGSVVVPFSAPSAARLPEVLRRHRAVLTAESSLAAVAATLQQGREHHAARVAVVARTVGELSAELDALLAGAVDAGAVRAAAGSDAQALAAARRWTSGGALDRAPLSGVTRLNLPGLPFHGEHFWLREAERSPDPVPATATSTAVADAGPVAGGLGAARSFMEASAYDAIGVRRALERLGVIGSRLAALAVREHLGATGTLSGADVLSGLPAVEPYGRFVTRLADVVTGAPRPLPDAGSEREAIEREFTRLVADHPEVADHVALAKAVIPNIPDVVTGRSSALELYFGGEIDELLSRIYTGNAIADHYNAVVARLADGYIRDRLAERPGEPVRILEVGAGTGGTTGPGAPAARPLRAAGRIHVHRHLRLLFPPGQAKVRRHGRAHGLHPLQPGARSRGPGHRGGRVRPAHRVERGARDGEHHHLGRPSAPSAVRRRAAPAQRDHLEHRLPVPAVRDDPQLVDVQGRRAAAGRPAARSLAVAGGAGTRGVRGELGAGP
ncbi:ketoacyl-synthetase C-terminal extension domain-containing protein [Streptomyces sp. S1A(2023)]